MKFPKPFYSWRPHPWHGLEVGKNPPIFVNSYIEITPFDLVKYEVDKSTGYLRVDRTQRTSSQPAAPDSPSFLALTQIPITVLRKFKKLLELSIRMEYRVI